jgi:hypothetical protein
MVRVASALLLALCAAVANAQGQDLGSVAAAPISDSAVFVNDVNAPAAATGNGFGAGLAPEAVAAYSAPQLVAPRTDELPQPIPQTATAARSADALPHPEAAAALPAPNGAVNTAPHPEAAAAFPAPSAETRAIDTAPHPEAAAAFPAPNAETRAIDTAPHPEAAAAMPMPSVEARAAADPPAHPEAAAAMAAPDATVNSKATNFKAGDSAESSSAGGGTVAATLAAGAVACVLAVAAVAVVRRRKNLKVKNSKTPGTPKNELTFFHVQCRLTPPAV